MVVVQQFGRRLRLAECCGITEELISVVVVVTGVLVPVVWIKLNNFRTFWRQKLRDVTESGHRLYHPPKVRKTGENGINQSSPARIQECVSFFCIA